MSIPSTGFLEANVVNPECLEGNYFLQKNEAAAEDLPPTWVAKRSYLPSYLTSVFVAVGNQLYPGHYTSSSGLENAMNKVSAISEKADTFKDLEYGTTWNTKKREITQEEQLEQDVVDATNDQVKVKAELQSTKEKMNRIRMHGDSLPEDCDRAEFFKNIKDMLNASSELDKNIENVSMATKRLRAAVASRREYTEGRREAIINAQMKA